MKLTSKFADCPRCANRSSIFAILHRTSQNDRLTPMLAAIVAIEVAKIIKTNSVEPDCAAAMPMPAQTITAAMIGSFVRIIAAIPAAIAKTTNIAASGVPTATPCDTSHWQPFRIAAKPAQVPNMAKGA